METLLFNGKFLIGCYFPVIDRSASCTHYQISSRSELVVEVFSTDEFSLLFLGGKSYKVNRDRRFFRKHVHTIVDLDSTEMIGEIEVEREEGFTRLFDGRNFRFCRGFGLDIRKLSTWFRNYYDVYHYDAVIIRFDIKGDSGDLVVPYEFDRMAIATSIFVYDEARRLAREQS